MANLPEVDQFDAGVYQLETTDPALGGANGVMNTPPKSLANRTKYLLNRIIDGVLSFVLDSGIKNAIVASLPQPAPALVDGMEVSFRVAVTNDSACTLKLTNTGGPTLPTLPLYGGDYLALAGGELPAGASVRAKLNLSLNSGTGAWVIQSIAGGFAKIPTPPVGDATTKAANMAALFAAADGMATVNVGVGADITLTAAQYGNAILKLTGTPTAPINLILPAQTGQWIIINQQGGTNNITVKPSGGTGVVLPQGNQTVIVCSDSATATFASAQAGQALLTPVSITGVTGSTLTVPGGYTPGALFIEKNGGLLEAPDFSATTSPTISLTKAAVSTDYFTVYRFTTFNVANAVQKSGDTMSGPLVLAGGDTGATPAQGDNSTKLATTAFVQSAMVGVQGAFKNLVLSATGTNATVSVSADQVGVANSANTFAVLNAVSLAINSASTGANGLDTGTLAASTWYSVWVIWNGTTVAGLLSLSATAPTMPSGYTYKARVGWMRTDGTANKYPLSYVQLGRQAQYKVAAGSNVTSLPVLASGVQGTVGSAGVQILASAIPIPLGAAKIRLALFVGASATLQVSPNSNVTNGPGSPALTVGTTTANLNLYGEIAMETSSLYYAGNGSSSICTASVFGWEDNI